MSALTIQELPKITLKQGSHDSREEGVCALEAVAWLAGEKHTDRPACACPVIADFIRRWNDGLPTDEDRNRLIRPLLPELVGTRSTAQVERARVDLLTTWLTQQATPASLELAGLHDCAARLRADPSLENLRFAAAEAGKKWDAAWAAAWAAARDAAWAAARDAAWAAARDAAWAAARDAARAAARDAAWDAAWAAAWDAARDADQYGRTAPGTDRNHYCTSPDSRDGLRCRALCSLRLMEDASKRIHPDLIGGEDQRLYRCTPRGIDTVALTSPPPPKLTRAQRRYRAFLEVADFYESFADWLSFQARLKREDPFSPRLSSEY